MPSDPQDGPQINSKLKYSSEAKCIGFREVLEESRTRRELKPQPWIARKFAVGIVVACWIYAYYVYVGRLSFEILRPHRNGSALGTRVQGIGLLIGFNLLWLMFGWSYFTTVFTSPGYAKHHAKKEPRPDPTQDYSRPSWDSDEEGGTISGPRYAPGQSPTSQIPPGRPHNTSVTESRETGTGTKDPVISHKSAGRTLTEENAQAMGAAPKPPLPAHTNPRVVMPPTEHIQQGNILAAPIPQPRSPHVTEMRSNTGASFVQGSSAWFGRSPPQHGTLLPEYRYCSKEGFVKPLRAHHCRSCGKCVLQYDHHCPWIGQCVGARNRRLFIIFLFWSTLTTLFIFISLLILNIKALNSADIPVDPPQIVLIAITGLFAIFTLVLLTSQIHLVLLNLTTVEHLSVRSQHEREGAVLNRQYSICNFGARRRARKTWDAEWGRPGKEGNIWWLGSARTNFESVFGKDKLYWLFPISKNIDDGLSYPVNPRFDSKGRWRPRREWPKELQ